MKTETVEEFLARGGIIEYVAPDAEEMPPEGRVPAVKRLEVDDRHAAWRNR